MESLKFLKTPGDDPTEQASGKAHIAYSRLRSNKDRIVAGMPTVYLTATAADAIVEANNLETAIANYGRELLAHISEDPHTLTTDHIEDLCRWLNIFLCLCVELPSETSSSGIDALDDGSDGQIMDALAGVHEVIERVVDELDKTLQTISEETTKQFKKFTPEVKNALRQLRSYTEICGLPDLKFYTSVAKDPDASEAKPQAETQTKKAK